MVRKIVVEDTTIGQWGAIDALFAEEIRSGTFEDTVVYMDWSSEDPSLSIGINHDGDDLDTDVAAERGYRTGRRYMPSGGHMMCVPETPQLNFYYQKEDATLAGEFERHGEAITRALEYLGFSEATYEFGDTEVKIGDLTAKIAGSGTSSLEQEATGYRSITMGVIWGQVSADTAEVMDDAFRVPPEKFEDKDSDSLTARVRPLSDILANSGRSLSKDRVLDAIVEANAAELFGDGDVVEADWRPAEEAFIRDLAPFFESDVWLDRQSTSKLCVKAPEDSFVGLSAYKSRKLIMVSVVLGDDGRIHDAMYSGDMFIRPQPTVTGKEGALDALAGAIVGLDPADENALRDAISSVFEQSAFEAPELDPEDLVIPVTKAANNTEPVGAYLDRH